MIIKTGLSVALFIFTKDSDDNTNNGLNRQCRMYNTLFKTPTLRQRYIMPKIVKYSKLSLTTLHQKSILGFPGFISIIYGSF